MGMSRRALTGNHVILGFRLNEIYRSVSFSAPGIRLKNCFFPMNAQK